MFRFPVMRSLRPVSNRRGLTLIEVLVALAIMATLTAIVVPTVSRQLEKANLNRLAVDLDALGNAVRQFYVDVQRWPDDLSQLTDPPARDGSAPALGSGRIPADLAALWKGPYLTRSRSGAEMESGAGSRISSRLDVVDWNGVEYVTLSVNALSEELFVKLDSLRDSGDGRDTGRYRFDAGAQMMTVYILPR